MLIEKDGICISVREYKSVVGEHGKMVSYRIVSYRIRTRGRLCL